MLEGIKTAGITLNAEKHQFCQTYITFVDHVIHHNGISPDLNSAIVQANDSICSQLIAFFTTDGQKSNLAENSNCAGDFEVVSNKLLLALSYHQVYNNRPLQR